MRFLPDVQVPYAACRWVVREPRIQNCGKRATHYMVAPPYTFLHLGATYCEDHCKQMVTSIEQASNETWGFANIVDPYLAERDRDVEGLPHDRNWKPADGQV